MSFREELTRLINITSQENNSNTPDWILAQYLTDCLTAFDNAVNRREKWYNRDEHKIKKQFKIHDPELLKYGRCNCDLCIGR